MISAAAERREFGRELVVTGRHHMDRALRHLQEGDTHGALETLVPHLEDLRRRSSAEIWRHGVVPGLREHRLLGETHRSPFTRRAFEKPRGYPGDAGTLEYIYRLEPPTPDVDPGVRRFREWEWQTPSCRSVRRRKERLAEAIEKVVECTSGASVLSVACGHLRELDVVSPALHGEISAFFALDNDPEALRRVMVDHGHRGVTPIHGSVTSILRRQVDVPHCDLIYAAGLFDYLSDGLGRRLVTRLFEMLRPGGVLLIPNFAPDLRDIAYLEVFMDWFLIYRDDAAMRRLCDGIDGELRIFQPDDEAIVYLEVEKPET